MAVTLVDPVHPFDPPSRPSEPDDDADGGRKILEPLGDDRSGMPASRLPRRAPADDVRAALRPRGSRGKTSFELTALAGFES